MESENSTFHFQLLLVSFVLLTLQCRICIDFILGDGKYDFSISTVNRFLTMADGDILKIIVELDGFVYCLTLDLVDYY